MAKERRHAMSVLRDDLITVAIPAYNAAATLDQTLLSVRHQSYANLEILVIDDGSTDVTASLARRHADIDRRVSVVRQRNAGVSAARNEALRMANGALFATLDADDLWHPDKLTRQLSQISRAGPKTVLCYTWFAYIDEHGVVLSTAEPCDEGNVLARMCRGNLLGNGSSSLIRTDVLREVGGWDINLAGGNEDHKTFFLLAERGEFCVVRAHFVGYRQARDSRSSKALRMLASYDQILAEVRPHYPQYQHEFAAGRIELIAYLFDKAVLNRKWQAAVQLLRTAWAQDRVEAHRMLLASPLIASRLVLPLSLRARLRLRCGMKSLQGRQFVELDTAHAL